ncbi:MAG: ABC transporter permease [Bacteroidia bacterium]|jgi:peptide/nickel transport system permease protein|nr:ABC transporter permease [Bacteroidia bacterium]
MISFWIKKVPFFIAVLLGLIGMIFYLFQALPGPEQILSGQRTDKATTDAIVRDLGLDQPVYSQAISYLNDVSPISVYSQDNTPNGIKGIEMKLRNHSVWIKWPYLRRSFQTKRLVSEMLSEAFIGTMILAFAAILIAVVIGIPLGVFAARKEGSFVDKSIVAFSTLGISVPSFFSAMLLSWLFGFVWNQYTGLPMTGSWRELSADGSRFIWKPENLILPAFALGLRPVAVFIQLARNNMADTLKLDFIQTAKAKGLSTKKVLWKHAFPNALNPLVTSIGGWFSSLLAGSFFTEYIFQWKGLGKVTIEALQQSDFPVVMGGVLFTACLFFVINTLTEVLYVWIDPRVRS